MVGRPGFESGTSCAPSKKYQSLTDYHSLCALQGCRILHFMIHDRISFGGVRIVGTWHGAATLALLPIFIAGVVRTRRLRREQVGPRPLDRHSSLGVGRGLLLLTSAGISAEGLTITAVGTTSV